MKIISFLCQFQDPEYLDAAIESFKWLPEKLYIIEGAWQSALSYGEPKNLRSGNDVYNIIDKHVDNKKVFLIQANEATEVHQRNIGMEKAKEDDADWLWMLDSDEIYTRSVMTGIHKIMQNTHASVGTLRLRSYNFINSFKRWFDGDYARIFRVKNYPGARFTHNNHVLHGNTYKDHMVRNVPEVFRFHHYNYVKRDPGHMWRKIRAHESDDAKFKEEGTPHYQHDGKVYQIPNNIPLYRFTGKHPAIMKSHPNFVNNIYNDDDLIFLRE